MSCCQLMPRKERIEFHNAHPIDLRRHSHGGTMGEERRGREMSETHQLTCAICTSGFAVDSDDVATDMCPACLAERNEALADVDLGYRGRGRPRLDPQLRRKEKLIISLTVPEMRRIMLAAAGAEPVPLSPNDWARQELLRLAPEKKS